MRSGLIAAAVMVVIMIVGFFVMNRRQTDRELNGPAQFRARVVLGETALVHEEVPRSDEDRELKIQRLTVVGAGDGRVHARVVVGPDAMACGPATPGRIWCAMSRKAELRDAVTLAVVADHAKVAAAVGSALSDWDPWIDRDTGELVVHTVDRGNVAVDVSLKTRGATRPAGDARSFGLAIRAPRSLTN